MKALTRTSIMIVAVAGLLALMAGTAMAAPADMEMAHPVWQDGVLINQHTLIDDSIITQVEPMLPQDGDQDTPGVDDGGDDDGQDTPGVDDGGDDGQDTPGVDDGGDDGQDTPGVDDGGDDQNVTPPSSNSSSQTSTGKLPNTGTSLALLVAFALVIAGIAYAARRAAIKRTR